MEKPKYVYEEVEGSAKVVLTVPVDEKTLDGMRELIAICKRLHDRIAKDYEELSKK